ncbi:tRNA methyltransferase 10 homolog A-like [Gigantopelta aegis]|uniref:tRNA methyltransferase 10 homolog A-like n=1 Tax=Gigantopelta aegis TaxID=1735272 RepID=UPI001B88D84F|nr:tRNA methyltransferase 10 homolog A-like [Gigantopelta aegis]
MERQVENEENLNVNEKEEKGGDHNERTQADVQKDSSQNTTISKNQLKRQRKHERWLQIKAQKRKDEKLKKKKKFAEAREKGELSGPTRKSLKKNCMQHSSCKIKVALDCSFDSYMTPKDVVHLVQQIQHSYSANRRVENPLQFYVCGVDGKTKQRLEDIGDYKGWDVYMEDKNYIDAFDKERIVYLSSESPNILKTLDEDKVYIIGGLVDHNHHKGLCHQLAEEKGVGHAQLPIGEYIEMKSRKVLTINHVFEILLKYTETGDWQSAFYHVLPQRKGFSVREKDPSQNSEVPHGDTDAKSDVTDSVDSCDNKQTADVRETTSNGGGTKAVNSFECIKTIESSPENRNVDLSLDSKKIFQQG